MSTFELQDPGFGRRVRASFERHGLMKAIGARLTKVAPGDVEIEIAFRDDLTQQHGFLHAGIVTAIVDTACGYAALSLMPAESAVLTIEYKVNFLVPARGERFIARGRVAKPGRTITVCAGDVFALGDGEERLVATMLATLMRLSDRPGLEG